MYGICWLLAIIVSFAFQAGLSTEASRKATEHRHQSMQLNEMAAHIRSDGESEKLVDSVAEMFKDELPPGWDTDTLRRRVARAEYNSATNATYLIPEERVAAVWDEYVRKIGAPDEALVTQAEIHNLRDAQFASSQRFWDQDINRSIWTMPNVVAVGADGKVANGCRALEAIRLIYLMDNLFENVCRARKRVQEGIVVSDEMAQRANASAHTSRTTTMLVASPADANPIRPAERRYIRERGSESFNRLLGKLFAELFPDQVAQ